MRCSLLCFLLTHHWARGKWHTSVGGWKSAPCTVAGKVFNWGWNPLWVGRLFFFFKAAVMGMPFLCVVLVPSEGWRHLQHAINMGRSHHVPVGTCECTLFSASLPLHKWKWSCGAVRHSGWSVAVAILQVPRHSFTGEKWQKSCSLAFPFFMPCWIQK